MREFRPYGSVRGALRNERPYRDRSYDVALLLRAGPRWPSLTELEGEWRRFSCADRMPTMPKRTFP